MVLLDMALVSFCRLSIVTMSLSAAVWLQFATQYLGQCWKFALCRKLCKYIRKCVNICWPSGAGGMVGPPCQQLGFLFISLLVKRFSVSALTLLAGQQARFPVCKKKQFQRFLWRPGLTCVNSRKPS